MELPVRTVSPLGASRFEQPYTPQSSQTSPKHHRNRSSSRWSQSESHSYATAATSIEQPNNVTISTSQEPSHDHEDWDEDDLDFSSISDECPNQAALAAISNIPIYTSEGFELPFGAIYDPVTALHQRQLLVFIRHFYCGACQAYVKALTEEIPLQEYFTIPVPTSIIIIGCGKPDLIPFYKTVTGTSFAIFAEPSRRLYKMLGMVLSTKIGSQRPEYMRDISAHAWLTGQVKTVRDGLQARKDWLRLSKLTDGFQMMPMDDESDAQSQFEALRRAEALLRAKSLRKRDIVRGGNMLQTGGEYLIENGEVVWCHRMRHYRDHTEVCDIRHLLELGECV